MRALTRLYSERVTHVDGLIGDLVEGLGALGLAARTTVVVTADHGEQLGEHGRWAHGPDLHDELIRVPLLMRGPDLAKARRVGDQVELLGLAPTLLDLLGIPSPTSFLGSSFASLARGGAGGGSPTVISEVMHSGGRRSRFGVPDEHTVTSCRTGDWKYIFDTEDDRELLYDLRSDPGELADVAAGLPEQTAPFRELVQRHRDRVNELAPMFRDRRDDQPDSDDEALRRRLAALGYL